MILRAEPLGLTGELATEVLHVERLDRRDAARALASALKNASLPSPIELTTPTPVMKTRTVAV